MRKAIARGTRKRGLALALSCSALVLAGFAAVAPAASLTWVFSEGFESGGMPGWYEMVAHSGVHSGAQPSQVRTEQSIVHSGSWAWRDIGPGGVRFYAYHPLPAIYGDVTVKAWVYVASHTSSAKLFAVRRHYGHSLEVYVDQRNRVSVRNNIAKVTTHGTTTMASGSWHRVELHAVIGAGNGSFEVSVDGAAVPDLSLTGQNLGDWGFDELRLGDIAQAPTFDIVIDDVRVRGAKPLTGV